jgi:hypothetical protein
LLRPDHRNELAHDFTGCRAGTLMAGHGIGMAFAGGETEERKDGESGETTGVDHDTPP